MPLLFPHARNEEQSSNGHADDQQQRVIRTTQVHACAQDGLQRSGRPGDTRSARSGFRYLRRDHLPCDLRPCGPEVRKSGSKRIVLV